MIPCIFLKPFICLLHACLYHMNICIDLTLEIYCYFFLVQFFFKGDILQCFIYVRFYCSNNVRSDWILSKWLKWVKYQKGILTIKRIEWEKNIMLTFLPASLFQILVSKFLLSFRINLILQNIKKVK